jgi:hypothetical protein
VVFNKKATQQNFPLLQGGVDSGRAKRLSGRGAETDEPIERGEVVNNSSVSKAFKNIFPSFKEGWIQAERSEGLKPGW